MVGYFHSSFHAPYDDVKHMRDLLATDASRCTSPLVLYVLLLLLHSPASPPSPTSPPQDLAVAMDARRDILMFFAGRMDGKGGPQVGY